MFTRCPHCDAQQAVTTQQLRDSRGLLACVACGQAFDALPALTELAEETVKPPQQAELGFPAANKHASIRGWRIGSVAMALLLMAQIGYFQADKLMRQPQVHAAASQFCQAVGCRLAAYGNPDYWSLSHGDLQAHLLERFVLTAALTNQAGEAQAYPALKLTLNDYSGQPIAERIFMPQQYAINATLAGNQTVQIRLPLVASIAEMGGFNLTLL